MIPPFRPLNGQAKDFIKIYVPDSAHERQVKDMTMAFKCGYLAACAHMFETMDAASNDADNHDEVIEALNLIREDAKSFSVSVMDILDKAKAEKEQKNPTKLFDKFYKSKHHRNN